MERTKKLWGSWKVRKYRKPAWENKTKVRYSGVAMIDWTANSETIKMRKYWQHNGCM